MSSSRPHRCDEFPAEYSLASCSPAELASASSAARHAATHNTCSSSYFQRTVTGEFLHCLNRRGHPTQRRILGMLRLRLSRFRSLGLRSALRRLGVWRSWGQTTGDLLTGTVPQRELSEAASHTTRDASIASQSLCSLGLRSESVTFCYFLNFLPCKWLCFQHHVLTKSKKVTTSRDDKTYTSSITTERS